MLRIDRLQKRLHLLCTVRRTGQQRFFVFFPQFCHNPDRQYPCICQTSFCRFHVFCFPVCMPGRKNFHAPLHGVVRLIYPLPVVVIEIRIFRAQKIQLILCRNTLFFQKFQNRANLPWIDQHSVTVFTFPVIRFWAEPVPPEIGIVLAKALQDQRPPVQRFQAALQTAVDSAFTVIIVERHVPPVFHIRQNIFNLQFFQQIPLRSILCRFKLLCNIMSHTSLILLRDLLLHFLIDLRIPLPDPPCQISVILCRNLRKHSQHCIRRLFRHPHKDPTLPSVPQDRPLDIGLLRDRQELLQRFDVPFKPFSVCPLAGIQHFVRNVLFVQRHGKTEHGHEPVGMLHCQKRQIIQECYQIIPSVPSGEDSPHFHRHRFSRFRLPHKRLQPLQHLSFRLVFILKHSVNISHQTLLQIIGHLPYPGRISFCSRIRFICRDAQHALCILQRSDTVQVDRRQKHLRIHCIFIITKLPHPDQRFRILPSHLDQKPDPPVIP